MNALLKYKKNITSQWGEDGLIEEIFRRIGIQEKICIEFGAWDGKHLSNVWNLWHELNWSALLIEGDKKKFNDLVSYTSKFEKVKPHCAYVKSNGKNCLDEIIKKTFPKKTIDLLSIDIDGNDYYILESLEIKPRIIIIEYNPTIPVDMELIQETDQYFGSSAFSINNLAHEKGYRLITATETNLFFIHKDEFKKLQIDEPTLQDVYLKDNLTYILTAYDGTPALTRIPTYNNIYKSTERVLSFKNQNLPTVNINIYTHSSYFIEYLNKILYKIKAKLNIKNKKVDLQSERVIPWFKTNGDKTLRLDYDLNPSSLVIDVGGYEGQWASDIFAKYCCNTIIFEPVKEFYEKIKERFSKNEKVAVYDVGLSNKSEETKISLLDDSSSLFKNNSRSESVKTVNSSDFLKEKNINNIDLMKINIEGGEYELLENLISNGFIKKVKNIQVQFHDFVPNAKERMIKIQKELEKTHHLTYQYEFVWENWERNDK